MLRSVLRCDEGRAFGSGSFGRVVVVRCVFAKETNKVAVALRWRVWCGKRSSNRNQTEDQAPTYCVPDVRKADEQVVR